LGIPSLRLISRGKSFAALGGGFENIQGALDGGGGLVSLAGMAAPIRKSYRPIIEYVVQDTEHKIAGGKRLGTRGAGA